MAAKPPKPPGNFLKSLLNQNNKQQHHNNEQQQQQETEGNSENLNLNTSTTDNCNTVPTTTNTKKTTCNCSNISIMHLFHEMKQEFPTIPDTIVAQCVNENCHQRENCIQMLRNELELNPIPVQSYPAKVLHPPQTTTTAATTATNNNAINTPTSLTQKPPLQQKPQIVQQKPPLKPLKPIRTAPQQPPITPQTTPTYNRNSPQLLKSSNAPLRNTTTTTNKNILHGGGGGESAGAGGGGGGGGELNDMPKQTQPLSNIANNDEVNNNNNENVVVCDGGGVSGESIERNLPRARPTTLNLNTHEQKQQQQQRQRLNIQLQKHFQEQRNKQQQLHTTKPIRKAPLPPIAPKPSQFQLNSTINSVNNTFFNDSLSSNHTSPLSESEISVSVSLSTPSPTSSSSNTTTHHTPTHHQSQTKSPIRHRSVINLQPEPPYTRDFTSAATSTALATTTTSPGSQKSFTSVNLTLRPPVTPTTGSSPGTALQPSTIDITAGPGFSGASGGGKSLHYSSTSYDARLGYQQNFQITVTDEGGVFSASRIRPQQQQQRSLNQVNICENQYDDGNSGLDNNTNNNTNHVNSLYAKQQQSLQQQQQLYLLQHQQFHNNNVVALQQNIQNSINSPQGIAGGGVEIGGNMCVPPQQAVDEIIQRQKKRRDKLAAALRENKKRLGQVEQEINLITGPIPAGLSERLDIEIQKLRTDCQAMLRSSNPFTQQQQHQQQQQLAINQTQQPQPFPRQRPARPPPRPPPPRQTSLDFIQHHSQSSTPHTPPAVSLPNLNLYNTPSPTLAQYPQQQQQHSNSISPSFYHHLQQLPQQQSPLVNEDIYPDTDEGDYQDDDNDEEYEMVEHWECNMCTFRNHPQLNICEACDNVRILPGTLPNLSRAISNRSATSVASPSGGLLSVPSSSISPNGDTVINATTNNGLTTANGNLEHDTNLAQQQLPHFALHT